MRVEVQGSGLRVVFFISICVVLLQVSAASFGRINGSNDSVMTHVDDASTELSTFGNQVLNCQPFDRDIKGANILVAATGVLKIVYSYTRSCTDCTCIVQL